jgi:hypothetical protein
VIGIDANRDVLGTARARRLARAEFIEADLLAITDLGMPADGLWSSFAPAYFSKRVSAIARTRRRR